MQVEDEQAEDEGSHCDRQGNLKQANPGRTPLVTPLEVICYYS